MSAETPTGAPPPSVPTYARASATELISRVHPMLLAIGSVMAVCIVLGGFGAWLLSTASAQTTNQVEPVKTRLGFVEAQQTFMLMEQRETRLDIRVAAEARVSGMPPAILFRPMAPLPARPDAGN